MAPPKIQAAPKLNQTMAMKEIVKLLQDNPRSRFLPRATLKAQTAMMAEQFDPNFGQRSQAYRDSFINMALDQGAPPLNDLELAQKNIEEFGPVIGAMGGAAFGGSKAGAAGAITGGAIGAMGGIAFPEATQKLLAPKIPSNTTTRGLMQKMFTEGVTSTVFGAGGELAGTLFSRLFGPLRKMIFLGKEKLEPAVQQARAIIEPRSGSLSPAQLAGEHTPALVEFLENISQHGIFASKRFSDRFKLNDEVILKYADEIAEGFKTNLAPEEVSVLLNDTIRGGNSAASAISSTMHGVVDRVSRSGVKVDTDDVVTIYKNMLQSAHGQKLKDLIDLADEAGLVRSLDEYLTTTIAPPKHIQPPQTVAQPFKTPGGPPPQPQPQILSQASFKRADRARSELLRIERQTQKSSDPLIISAGRSAKKLAVLLGNQLDSAAQGLPPKAANAYRAAKAFTKFTKERFNNQLILDSTRTLLKDEDAFIRTFFSRTKLGTIKAIKKADRAINLVKSKGGQQILNKRAQARQIGGTPAIKLNPIMPEISNAFGNEILKRSMKTDALGTRTGIDGGKFRRILFDSTSGLGEDMAKEIFSPKVVEQLRQLSNAIEVADRRAKGPGRVVIQLAQGSAALSVLGSIGNFFGDVARKGVAAAATVVLLGPRQISKTFNDPQFTKNLADGIIGGPKSDAFRRMLTQLAVIEPDIAGNILPSPLTQAAKDLRDNVATLDPTILFDRNKRPIPKLKAAP